MFRLCLGHVCMSSRVTLTRRRRVCRYVSFVVILTACFEPCLLSIKLDKYPSCIVSTCFGPYHWTAV